MLKAKSEVCQAAHIAGRYQEHFHESQSPLPCDSVPPQQGVSSGEGRHVHKTGYKRAQLGLFVKASVRAHKDGGPEGTLVSHSSTATDII